MKWNMETAIVIAGALIGAAILVAGHYEMTASVNGIARLNRWTGTITTCVPGKTATNGVLVADCSPKETPNQ